MATGIIPIALESAGIGGFKTKNTSKNNNQELTFTYVDPKTGETRTGTIGGANYKFDNWFRTSRNTDVYYAIQYMLDNGGEVNSEELRTYIESVTGNPVAKSEMSEIISDANTFFKQEGIDVDTLGTMSSEEQAQAAQDAAFNSYYQDLYSLDEGTLGAEMLNNLATAEQNAAMSNMQLADAQYQQAAMQQAEAVKAITDQVRAERMSRLRAGMSESQIANQDMQIMLNNMNTLNQQANTMNANRLAAQQQYDLAQDTAYQQYLANATGLGSVGAAMAASDAGDAYMQTLKRMNATGESYKKANKYVTGQTSTK